MAPTLNCNHEAPYVARTLRGEGFDASEDGTGQGTPLVPMFLHANKGRPAGRQSAHTEMVSVKPIVETLTTDGHAQSAVAVPVAFDTTQITSAANYSNPKPGDVCHPLAAGAHAPAIVFPANLSGTQCASAVDVAPSMGAANPTAVAFNFHKSGNAASSLGVSVERVDCLRAFEKSPMAVQPAAGMQVRRLTPTEAERLQGFPDGYTAIPWRGKPADQCPDGPRYKALGNSWAVPCVAWIGRRIQRQIDRKVA
jgi:DNA (cytosine-5)-methyltransferase 1